MGKGNFLFNGDWVDVISELPNDVRLEVYDAISGYGIKGELPVLKPIAAVAFKFIRQDIDRQKERYRDLCDQNRANIRKRWKSDSSGHGGIRPNTTEYDRIRTDTEAYEPIPIEKEKKEKDIYITPHTLTSMSPPLQGETPTPRVSSVGNDLKNLKRREAEFIRSVSESGDQYPPELIDEFVRYWTEPQKSGKRMRFELERTWETSRRLATWARNCDKFRRGSPAAPDKSRSRNMDDVIREAQELLQQKSDTQNTESHGVQ